MKPEWMPENPYFNRGGYDDTSLSIGFREGSNVTAKRLLESLKNSMISMDNPYGKDWKVIPEDMLDFMLHQLEEENQ